MRRAVARRAPAVEDLGRRRLRPVEGLDVDEPLRVGDRLQHDLVPGRLVGGGEDGHLVGPGEVHHLGGDVPAGGRGRRTPAGVVQRRDQLVERRALRGEVVQHLVEQVGHACLSSASRVCAQAARIRLPPGGVVGDRVRQPEPAHQVEGRLDQLAHPRPVLVDTERVDRDPVGLATDPLLQGYDGRVQRLVGARGDPQLERGGEHRTGEVVGEHLEHRPGAPLAGRQVARRLAQLLAPQLAEVLDRRERPGRSWSGSGAAGHRG